MSNVTRWLAVWGSGWMWLLGSVASRADEFQLQPGDHVCLVGNTLAERMQHDGYFETALFHRFPQHQLVIRNLGYSGDDIFTQLRSQGFGTQDEHLNFNRADVIVAFFGYNESFADEDGLADFTARLNEVIAHWKSQSYNGKSPPRIVLCSPIAHEDLGTPNLPSGTENNVRMALYVDAMASVARDQGVTFVDLFAPSQRLYQASAEPLTINGVHLNELGNRSIAIELERSLFGSSELERDAGQIGPLRQAVLEKNFYWFQRYRTTDGYSIFGGRADLVFVDGQTNRDVMQREMHILDQITGLRDQAIWSLAQAQSPTIDDAATDPPLPVITNKPGKGPGGAHIALDERQSLEKMTVAQGFRVELFASEREFPQLVNPVQMSFDTKGRLWVATWPTYPHWQPKTKMNDSLLIFEDTDGDGRADVCKTFAGDLHNPTGFEFYNGGVLVANAPDLIFLKDTDGDDVADVQQRVLHGLDSADTHHTANSFVYDPGGALYFQEGTFHHTQVETPYGPAVRSANAAVFRFEPRTFKFEVYIPFGFANPHGHVFDRWGQDIVHDGTSSVPYHGSLISGYLDFPHKHPGPPVVYEQRTRPCPATEILSSRHFPTEMQGNLLVGNVIGFQGLLNYRIERDAASFRGTEVEPLFSSSDESFRPVDFEVGPDGAVYFLDWYNPIIGHMQHNLRDPSRDKAHGRVYRVVAKDRPLLQPVAIHGEPIERLLDLLKEPEDRVRYRVKIELGSRPVDEVLAATQKWVGQLDSAAPQFEHHRLEALWLFQSLNVVDKTLLDQVLRSREPLARAAATRVLCAWRDRIDDALPRLKQLAQDADPLVRLEAVRAASYLKSAPAVDVALVAASQPTDKYLDYVIQESIRGLKPWWRVSILEGQPLALTKPDSISVLVRHLEPADLIKAPGERAIYAELLFRPGVPEQHRRRALTGLASATARPPSDVVLDALSELDSDSRQVDDTVIFDLVRFLSEQPKNDLSAVRQRLVELGLHARRGIIRQMGFVALIAADGQPKEAWELAHSSPAALSDFVQAIPLILDPEHRAQLYDPLRELIVAFPPSLVAQSDTAPATVGRYVRIELPGKNRVLTLAEVEVTSAGRNIAPEGAATQKNTAYGADASRAVDGNRSGVFSDNGQTHSEDSTDEPWWELDLQKSAPIDSVTIYNRTEEKFGERLAGFKLIVLDENRKVVVQKEDLAAPSPMETYPFPGQNPVDTIRHAALKALASVRGTEAQSVALLVEHFDRPEDRAAAITGLQKISIQDWPQEAAAGFLNKLIAYIQSIPESRRTSPAVLDALQLADAVAGSLPAAEAQTTRRMLGQLGVRVIRLSTVPHRMIYDQETIVVQAAKPVELIFENSDIMPHNVVITEMGALAEVGLLSEATATDADAARRGYVPASNRILVASPLVSPQSVRKLSFQAPAKTGVYPIVCTYPGHWRTMYAAMFVVDDLAEYLANPETYLAQHPLQPQDELLANRRPRTAWTLADLEPRVQALSAPSFENGRRMFQVANCMACHRLDGQGLQFGADLEKLDPKFTPAEILRAVVEPSFEINKDFQSYKFEMIDGKSHSGIVVSETDKEVRIVENPLVSVEPLVLLKEDIDVQTKSTKSLMPEGLLDRLSQHEVTDLIAFVLARGDRNHPLYRVGPSH